MQTVLLTLSRMPDASVVAADVLLLTSIGWCLQQLLKTCLCLGPLTQLDLAPAVGRNGGTGRETRGSNEANDGADH